MSAVDWVCQKIALESASDQLSAITSTSQSRPRALLRMERDQERIAKPVSTGVENGQQVLPSKRYACANVTTCCCVN